MSSRFDNSAHTIKTITHPIVVTSENSSCFYSFCLSVERPLFSFIALIKIVL
jgi:hypothetical protein